MIYCPECENACSGWARKCLRCGHRLAAPFWRSARTGRLAVLAGLIAIATVGAFYGGWKTAMNHAADDIFAGQAAKLLSDYYAASEAGVRAQATERAKQIVGLAPFRTIRDLCPPHTETEMVELVTEMVEAKQAGAALGDARNVLERKAPQEVQRCAQAALTFVYRQSD